MVGGLVVMSYINYVAMEPCKFCFYDKRSQSLLLEDILAPYLFNGPICCIQTRLPVLVTGNRFFNGPLGLLASLT